MDAHYRDMRTRAFKLLDAGELREIGDILHAVRNFYNELNIDYERLDELLTRITIIEHNLRESLKT